MEETINCPHCGKEQRANRTVCWTCGKDLRSAPDPAAQTVAATAEPKASAPVDPPKPRPAPVPTSSGNSTPYGTWGGGFGMAVMFFLMKMACGRTGACVEQDMFGAPGFSHSAKCSDTNTGCAPCKGEFHEGKSCDEVMTSMGYHPNN